MSQIQNQRVEPRSAGSRESGFKRILVPTDFSEWADRALESVVHLSRVFHAEIFVLHVFQLREYLTLLSERAQVDSKTADEVLETAKRRAAEQLEEIVRRLGGEEVVLIPALVIGVPFEEIVKYAAERKIDLIVMPMHGHTGLTHFLVGNTTERVIAHTGCPVLVLKEEHDQT